MDKNQAIIDYILTCPKLKGSPMYFNFINAKDNTNQILTTADDIRLNQAYIDGSVNRRYTFTIMTFRSISDMAIVQGMLGYPNENVEDLSDVQLIIDWIAEQRIAHSYPDFGEDCAIDDIYTTTDTPRLEGINTELTPPLAMYSISIQVDYLDKSQMLWK